MESQLRQPGWRNGTIARFTTAAFIILLLLESGLVWWFAEIPQARTFLPLQVVHDPEIYDWSPDGAPRWFHFDDPTVAEAAYFREAIEPVIDPSASTFEIYLAVMDWVRQQSAVADASQAILGDPITVHQAMLADIPAQCTNFATLYVAASTSVGLPYVRMWHFSAEDGWNRDGHIVVEVWVPEMDNWVMLDPMNNAYVMVDGEPGSVIAIREALLTGQHEWLEPVVGANAHTPPDRLLELYTLTMAFVRMEAAHTPLHDHYRETWGDRVVDAMPDVDGLPLVADRGIALASGRARHVILIDDLSGSAASDLPVRQAKAVFVATLVVFAVLVSDGVWMAWRGIRRLLSTSP